MRRLDLYIFRQTIVPFTLACFIVTAIVWMTQTLQRADLLIDHHQGFAAFAQVSLLLIPSLLSVVLPFALFAAALYALHRLHSDSEAAVMFAAGISRARIALPLAAIGLAVAAATLYINADLMPRSYRVLKTQIAEMRADLASAVLRSGEFVSFSDRYTIYVDRTAPGGVFYGLLINETDGRGGSRTYMAERGAIRETENGPVVFLLNGNVQSKNAETGGIEFYRFEQTSVNVADIANAGGEIQLELTERYLGELFQPDTSKQWDRDNFGKLIAEGHGRLAAALYPFAYLLIGLFALLGGAYSRRGYAVRIAAACVAAGALRVAGFLAQSVAAETAAYWLVYAPPLLILASGIVALFGGDRLSAAFARGERA